MDIKKSGMIAIVGRPNVGKSTLTNALVGEKIAIVTNKPQTTRNRICAVVNKNDCQYVFLDTPGLHRARTRLGDYMVKVVRESVADVDAVLLLVEPIDHIGAPEAELIQRIKALNVPALLVINKIDTVEKEKLLSVMQVYGAAHDFAAILPISARNGEGVDELLELLSQFLPEGPQLFPEDMITDQPERQICAEIPPRHRRRADEVFRAGGRGDRAGRHHLLREGQPQGHHHRQGGRHAQKDLLPGPLGHGAVPGRQGVSPDLGKGEGELAGQLEFDP